MNTLLIGAGFMAREYAKVLDAQNKPFTVIGRSDVKVNEFKELFPHATAFAGGVDAYLATHPAAEYAIVASNVESLFANTRLLIEKGCKHLLVEKPAALELSELDQLQKLATQHQATINIAYNRRLYQSVAFAKKMITSDGGILSAHFEFTEWVHTIDPASYSKETLSKWIISNSTHVIDLVFSLIGKPSVLQAFVNNQSIPWHPSGAIFTGAGISEKNIPFTYHSNWKSAGRWSIELLTAENKYIFAPMEKLQIQKRGTVKVEPFEADYSKDIDFKPGLFAMVDAFYTQNNNVLCTLEQHISFFISYNKMAGYHS
jgi:predicted dehydrogenase